MAVTQTQALTPIKIERTSKVNRMRIVLAALFGVMLASCTEDYPTANEAELPTQAQAPLPTAPYILVGPEGQRIAVVAEIADDEPEREVGLMFRTELVSGTAMVFIFPEAQQLGFWMKNTLIPLDLLFFRAGELVAVIPWAKPHDETPLSPAELADTVLEVPGGWAAANGIGTGWRLVRSR